MLIITSERTTLAARVKHEVSCVAVENAESRHILAQRTIEAMKPKVHTKFITTDTSVSGGGFIHAGTIAASQAFGGMIVSFYYLP